MVLEIIQEYFVLNVIKLSILQQIEFRQKRIERMKINNLKAQQVIYDHIISKYNAIEVSPGKCRFNYKCQMNSVHEAKKNKHKKIAMCICMDDGTYPIIHFINYNKGEFVDNTLGEWSSRHKYYFIRWIKDDDMWDVDIIFTAFRRELNNQLGWWLRLTSDVTF